MTDQPTAENALKELEPLPRGVDAGGDAARRAFSGRARRKATFEWMEGNQHVIQRLDDRDARGSRTASACSAATRPTATYFQLYADDRGVCRVYEMSIGDGEWRLWREGEPFDQRFIGRFSDDVGRESTAAGRPGPTGEWSTDFDLVYTRVR